MPEPIDHTRGLSRYETTIRRALFSPLIAMIVLAGLSLWQITSLLSSLNRVGKADDIIYQANDGIKLLIDMEAGERGYLVDGDPKFLPPYKAGLKRAPILFETLATSVADDKPQADRVTLIRAAFDQWLANAHYEIGLRSRSRDSATARTFFDRGKGKRLMDDLRGQFDELSMRK